MLKYEREQQLKKPSVLIAGYGIVGRNLHKAFTWAVPYDKYKAQDEQGVLHELPTEHYDFCFVCVPTPMNEDGSADLQYVEDVVSHVDAGLFIIKSTIPPTTTEKLTERYKKALIFSPEYNGNTQHANVEHNFVIFGGPSELTEKAAQLYQYACNAYIRIFQVPSRTAELCKYMENSYLATKVTFCNEFYRMAKLLGVNYSELRECFVADPRINPSHTFVYEQYPYFDSKCFNKDLPALITKMQSLGYEPGFLMGVLTANARFMQKDSVPAPAAGLGAPASGQGSPEPHCPGCPDCAAETAPDAKERQ